MMARVVLGFYIKVNQVGFRTRHSIIHTQPKPIMGFFYNPYLSHILIRLGKTHLIWVGSGWISDESDQITDPNYVYVQSNYNNPILVADVPQV